MNGTLAFEARIVNSTQVQIVIGSLQFSDLKVISKVTPEIDLEPLAELINMGLKAAVPYINDDLSTLNI